MGVSSSGNLSVCVHRGSEATSSLQSLISGGFVVIFKSIMCLFVQLIESLSAKSTAPI